MTSLNMAGEKVKIFNTISAKYSNKSVNKTIRNRPVNIGN